MRMPRGIKRGPEDGSSLGVVRNNYTTAGLRGRTVGRRFDRAQAVRKQMMPRLAAACTTLGRQVEVTAP